MNFRLVIRIIGKLLLIEAACLAVPMFLALYYGEKIWVDFLIAMALCAGISLLTYLIPCYTTQIKLREGFAVVALGWAVFSALGALPIYLSETTVTYVDALFETISGFTTTGASVFYEIETLPRSFLFWRACTHWLGGMGILVFTVAVLPAMDTGSFQIIKAEHANPFPEKIVPRVKSMARIFYTIYIALTLAEILLLCLGGMPLFDSIIHSFGTVATGGVSSKTHSVGFYEQNSYIIWVITVFMVLSGINFSLYFFAWRTKIRYLLRSEEVRLYLGIILLGSLIVGVDLYRHGVYSLYGLEAFQNAFFQVAAIVSTTGFAIGDFGSWPNLSKVVIFFLFFVGSCAGSTGGSIKCIRWVICAKTIKRDFTRVLHPHAVSQIKVDDKVLSGESIAAIKSFVILYFLVFAAGSVLISLDGVDMTTAVSTVAITLGNIGFGFGSVSPSGSFAFYSDGSKLLLSFLMLLGRLELFTVLLLFTPAFWKKAI